MPHQEDIEKHPGHSVTVDDSNPPSSVPSTPALLVPSIFHRWNNRIENLADFEARGITRVPPDERQVPSVLGYIQMILLWFSANITINNLAVGLCGPLIFDLGFKDSALCAVFGTIAGTLPTAYMSIWGAASGNRTMV